MRRDTHLSPARLRADVIYTRREGHLPSGFEEEMVR
jgi:hypothetical protein